VPLGAAPGRLRVGCEGDALVLRIDSPARANALGSAMLGDIAATLAGPPPAGARAVLLTGAGERHFSAGVDLAEDAGARPDLTRWERLLARAAAAVEACPLPVIAVLNGAAMGGGLELAMACDWRIAGAGARLGMPAARLGVVYAPEGLRRFVAAAGVARTRRLFLTGRTLGAEEAMRLGLVDELVPEAELWHAALRAAADVAAAPPLAVEGTRAVLRALAPGPPGDADRALVEDWRRRAFASADHREALDAFRARRSEHPRGGGDRPAPG
jgi:enoyl-CoA hydratase/carnithine racemase